MSFRATLVLAGSAAAVRAVLCDVAAVASWNPALTEVASGAGPARVGVGYRARLRGLIPARLTYTAIGPGRVSYELRALGSAERGDWRFEPAGPGRVSVTHVFEHRGRILAGMAAAFARVAEWRLDRLAAEVARRPVP